jgi:hypothetical protein
MSTETTNSPELRRQMQENEIDQIFKAVWETAARRNPMVLVKMIDPDAAFQQLRGMIRDCLAKGLSATETHDHAVQELLQSATLNTQLHNTCNDSASHNEPRGPSAS